MENLSAACRKAEPCGSLPPVSNHAQDAVSPPRFRTMCRIPAAPRGSEPCAGCRQPAHGFLPARFHTCLSAHRFCPHFSACTLLSVLSYLYFYNYIFLFVFSYLRFPACTFPLALYARSFPLVLFHPRFPVCTFLIALSRPLFPACASLSIPSHSVIVPSSLFQPFRSFIRTETL